jgi:hypothetical protein
MRLLHIIVYVIVLLLIAGAAISYVDANAASHPAKASVNAPRLIEEDDPGWNCHTMGNGVCGNGPKVENDKRYQKYDRAFNCFAEVSYSQPKLPWTERVVRCIPPVSIRP